MDKTTLKRKACANGSNLASHVPISRAKLKNKNKKPANFPEKEKIDTVTSVKKSKKENGKVRRTQNHLTTRIFSIHLLPQQLTGQCGRFQFL